MKMWTIWLTSLALLIELGQAAVDVVISPSPASPGTPVTFTCQTNAASANIMIAEWSFAANLVYYYDRDTPINTGPGPNYLDRVYNSTVVDGAHRFMMETETCDLGPFICVIATGPMGEQDHAMLETPDVSGIGPDLEFSYQGGSRRCSGKSCSMDIVLPSNVNTVSGQLSCSVTGAKPRPVIEWLTPGLGETKETSHNTGNCLYNISNEVVHPVSMNVPGSYSYRCSGAGKEVTLTLRWRQDSSSWGSNINVTVGPPNASPGTNVTFTCQTNIDNAAINIAEWRNAEQEVVYYYDSYNSANTGPGLAYGNRIFWAELKEGHYSFMMKTETCDEGPYYCEVSHGIPPIKVVGSGTFNTPGVKGTPEVGLQYNGGSRQCKGSSCNLNINLPAGTRNILGNLSCSVSGAKPRPDIEWLTPGLGETKEKYHSTGDCYYNISREVAGPVSMSVPGSHAYTCRAAGKEVTLTVTWTDPSAASASPSLLSTGLALVVMTIFTMLVPWTYYT